MATAILDRHVCRRAAGVPTVSVLVDPIASGLRLWSRWAEDAGHLVVVAENCHFPLNDWVRSITEEFDVQGIVFKLLAQRANRESNEFVAEWRSRTSADRSRFWNTIPPNEYDDVIHRLTDLSTQQDSQEATTSLLCKLGEAIVPALIQLAPEIIFPSVLFVARSSDDLSAICCETTNFATKVPNLPIAISVSTAVWDQYLATAQDSRAKTLLREGELRIPRVDPESIARILTDAGASHSVVEALIEFGADESLLEAAKAAVEAAQSPADIDRSRSAAERFLFEFLESIPDTRGRFELNGKLDFKFGNRLAEVDLLCRDPLIALELDGYYHFTDPECYRRDREKDWELQQRGFLVLRFLSTDVTELLEQVRDRILMAMNRKPIGGSF